MREITLIKLPLRHLLTTLLALLIASGAESDEPVRLRVLSYNIHHAEGVDRTLDLARIARVILSVEPDLVALQEVDKEARRTESIDQPIELANMTKMNVVFGGNIELQGGHYGNAVLSRFPIIRHQNHLLPNIDNGEQRGFLEVEINVPNSNEHLLMLATHLDHRSNDEERLASANAMNSFIATHGMRPALLAGDLNDGPKSRTLNQFESVWLSANDNPLPTIPVNRPTKQIDFILCRPSNRWRIIGVDVLDEAVASDHRAILAVLELLADEGQ